MTDNQNDVKIKIAKLAVLILTLMLIGGIVFLFFLISAKKNKNPQIKPSSSFALTPEKEKIINLNQPLGSQINSFQVENGYLYLELSDGGASPRIFLIDTSSGKHLLTVNVGKQ
jgi:hypothetical protein